MMNTWFDKHASRPSWQRLASQSLVTLANDFLQQSGVNIKALDADSDGQCWWFAKNFSKFLSDRHVPNSVVDMRNKERSGNHLVVKSGGSFVDFAFNQFGPSKAPAILTQADYAPHFTIFNEYPSFDAFVSGFKENKDWWAKYEETLRKPTLLEPEADRGSSPEVKTAMAQGPQQTAVAWHGTTAWHGVKIKKDGFIRPRGQTGIGTNWGSGVLGGNPSADDLVYVAIDEKMARYYAIEVCERSKTKKAAIVKVEVPKEKAVLDEDFVFETLQGEGKWKATRRSRELTEALWKMYARVCGVSTIDDAKKEWDTRYDHEWADSALADDMKEVSKIASAELPVTLLNQARNSSTVLAFNQPLKVLDVAFFDVPSG